ncbi:hypothetical protein Taro_014055, partial [Colocasia esculenta]|nr:hypothetical protein [Colocasia esculenta]
CGGEPPSPPPSPSSPVLPFSAASSFSGLKSFFSGGPIQFDPAITRHAGPRYRSKPHSATVVGVWWGTPRPASKPCSSCRMSSSLYANSHYFAIIEQTGLRKISEMANHISQAVEILVSLSSSLCFNEMRMRSKSRMFLA